MPKLTKAQQAILARLAEAPIQTKRGLDGSRTFRGTPLRERNLLHELELMGLVKREKVSYDLTRWTLVKVEAAHDRD